VGGCYFLRMFSFPTIDRRLIRFKKKLRMN